MCRGKGCIDKYSWVGCSRYVNIIIYFKQLFDSIIETKDFENFHIILNAITPGRDLDYYKGNIPAHIIAKYVKDMPEDLMKNNSVCFVEFFRDNKMENLAKEIETKYK